MLKILHITFEAPSRRSGGGLGILQSLIATSSTGIVDYLGPEYDSSEFSEVKINKYIFLKKEKNAFRKIKSLILGVSMGNYYPWMDACKKIEASQYDVIYIDFSRHDYIVRWAKENKKPVIVRVHNVEQDYFKRVAISKGESKVRFASVLKYFSMKKRERYCMKHADKLLFLTENDLNRADELYGVNSRRNSIQIMPVCIQNKNSSNVHANISTKYFLITGSLWYGANADGVKWFINNVWSKASKLFDDYALVVAGSRPNEEIREACAKACRCILVESPDDMAPYFNDASFYIAPVFDGAGMKVKVAEAMSYGLPVIGTKHAMIGYERSLEVNKVICTDDECLKAMTELYNNVQSFDKNRVKQIFNKYYDMSVSEKIVKNAIESIRRNINDNN